MVKEISAGAICYTYINNEIHFLILKHKNGNHYSFPKGHLEDNETLKECAIREVYKETNIKIEIINDNFKVNSYLLDNGNYKEVYYFLAKALTTNIIIDKDEVLKAGWYSKNEVLKTLTYENDKVMFFNFTKSLK